MTVERLVEDLPGQRRPAWAVAGSRTVRYLIGLLAVALLTVEAILLARHLSDVGAVLAHVTWSLLLLAVASEVCSLATFAAIYQRMLQAGGLRTRLRRVAGMVLAANALSATLPAGSALAIGYSFQRLRRFGASGPLAGWVIVVAGLVSYATFAVLGVAAALLVGTGTAGTLAVAVAVGAVLATGLVVRAATRRPDLLTAVGNWARRAVNRLRRREPAAGGERVHRYVEQLVAIRPSTVDWLAAVGYAALNWAADVACLVLVCHAAGITDLSPRVILIAYAADAAAGALQLLPGGLGTVDGALILALINGGIPTASAAAAVLLYRLISFALPAAVGWTIWFLARDRTRPLPARAAHHL
ncbi:MAG TPA: YbhN family protein [Gaiellales bacterium]|nr:YbhN family protein [Gaiellales bacterium]